MSQAEFNRAGDASLSRRTLMRAGAGLAGAAALAPRLALAQQNGNLGTPPSVITNPPRQWERGSAPEIYPGPRHHHHRSVVRDEYMLGHHRDPPRLDRLLLGEGPAWSARASTSSSATSRATSSTVKLRDDGRVTRVPHPSYNSNGNSFDFQGRQLSMRGLLPPRHPLGARRHDDGHRRYYDGKPLNSPNDLVPHPDGSIWFTDPPTATALRRPPGHGGRAEPPEGCSTRARAPNAGGSAARSGSCRPTSTGGTRAGSSRSSSAGRDADPNGLCFSPDYKTLYVCGTGKGPGDTGPAARASSTPSTSRAPRPPTCGCFTDMVVDGVHCGPDGLRADVYGELWCSSTRRSAIPACSSSTRRASSSAASACRRCAPTSPSAGRSATACSWREPVDLRPPGADARAAPG